MLRLRWEQQSSGPPSAEKLVPPFYGESQKERTQPASSSRLFFFRDTDCGDERGFVEWFVAARERCATANLGGMDMADGGRKPSFWETVPGFITAIAGLITALATLITALYTAKIIGQHEEPAKKEAGKEQGEANKQQKETSAENQVERKGSIPEAAAKEPVEAKQPKQGDTITDTASGLMWKRCPEGLSGVNCENGKLVEYTWDDAVKRFKNGWWAESVDC